MMFKKPFEKSKIRKSPAFQEGRLAFSNDAERSANPYGVSGAYGPPHDEENSLAWDLGWQDGSKGRKAFLKAEGYATIAKEEKDSQTQEEFYSDLIGKYGEVLEVHTALVRRESNLPASKEQIRKAIEWARTDPVFASASEMLDVGWECLNSFVPDEEYELTANLITKAMTALENSDDESYEQAIQQMSDTQKALLKSAIKTAAMSLRMRAST